jgi:thiol-disulfide isomerase/thioredoxin
MRTKLVLAPLALLLVPAVGCDQSTTVQMTPTSIVKTPDSVLEPRAIDEAPAPKAEDKTSKAEEKAATSEKKAEDTAGPAVEVKDLSAEAAAPDQAEVRLTPMKYDEYRSKAVVDPKSKLIVVDAWATWCTPCMENFPHLVEMHRKYSAQGLKCVSLSLDFPDDPKSFARATQFLKEQKATFLNVLLDEEQEDAFNKLDTNGVPTVFLYDPTGKEIRRFTMDDPNRQFTYDQVDEVVAKLLKGETLPEDAPGEVYKPRGK